MADDPEGFFITFVSDANTGFVYLCLFFRVLDLLVIGRLGLLSNMLHNPVDLGFAHIRSMHAHESRGAGREKKHIALAEEGLCAVRIENCSRIDLRRDAE